MHLTGVKPTGTNNTIKREEKGTKSTTQQTGIDSTLETIQRTRNKNSGRKRIPKGHRTRHEAATVLRGPTSYLSQLKPVSRSRNTGDPCTVRNRREHVIHPMPSIVKQLMENAELGHKSSVTERRQRQTRTERSSRPNKTIKEAKVTIGSRALYWRTVLKKGQKEGVKASQD